MSGIEAILADLRRLDGLAQATAKLAAPLVEVALRSTAAAGQTPDGKAWQPKKNGGAPLEHAAEHITVKAFGTVLRGTLSGPDVFHHFGGGRNPRRPILPDPGTIPPQVEAALRKAADEAFAKATG
jgi:hypothetical protein